MGVVAVISPWNFPTATAAWKIAPALAFGNAVVWKPANLTPASAVELTKIIAKQDIPAGLFNLVMGSGGSIGQALVESPGIDAISFTGSVPWQGHRSLGHRQSDQAADGDGVEKCLAVMEDGDLDLAVDLGARRRVWRVGAEMHRLVAPGGSCRCA